MFNDSSIHPMLYTWFIELHDIELSNFMLSYHSVYYVTEGST